LIQNYSLVSKLKFEYISNNKIQITKIFKLANMQITKISNLLKPLILSGIYRNEEMALKDIIVDYIQRKENFYQKTIRKFEKKNNMTFEEFSLKLKNSASMDSEDIWMEWKGAIEMKEAWRTALKQVLING
jgi:hypothetical protein